VLRLAGGRAAVFHEGTLELAHAVPSSDPRGEIHARFEETAGLVARALGRLGVDARVGEVPGEYCPGRWSVNAGGARKLAGIGQRVISGAAHVGTVVVVDDAAAVRRALEPIYAALDLTWDPATVGAVSEEAPGGDWAAVRDAVLAEYASSYELVEDALDAETLALARTLVSVGPRSEDYPRK
jgi:lipoate-protein ligase A